MKATIFGPFPTPTTTQCGLVRGSRPPTRIQHSSPAPSYETVKLWNPDDCHSSAQTPATPSASSPRCSSGKIAASASVDSFVHVFDVESNNTIATLEAPPSEVWQLQFNAQGIKLAVAGGGSASVKIWNTAELKLVATLSIPHPEGANAF